MANERRRFLRYGTAAAAALVAASPVPAAEHKKRRGQHHAFVVPDDTEGQCATCVFWGGERHVNREKTAVHVTSLGMCNNPASANYHTTTSPNTGPMKAWVKWPALDA